MSTRRMVKISIDTENAAFRDEDDPSHEVARILEQLADDMRQYRFEPGFHVQLRDVNGNIVGDATFKKEYD